MSRSEDILLTVKHVKHKKSEGTLYMMGTRMGWMLSSKDTFNISLNYADIKVQKVSPDTKEKVQLQVVMHDGGATTFHFVNPNGRPAQVKDREGIKELLQQLLPKFRRKINSELEEKNRMLQQDPDLFQLYKNLVVSGVVTAEEFWATRAPKKESSANSQQNIGISAAFLADVKPEADGCNGLKYNLTPDIIQSIFKTYPAVRQKHLEYVPDKLTEEEFWTRFFQSHYFHRDRINISNKDLFSECAKADDVVIRKEIEKPIDDPFMDLMSMSDSTLGEGYGSLARDTPEPSTSSHLNSTNASLIKRFNQHSTMILKACNILNNTSAAGSDGQEVVLNGKGTMSKAATEYSSGHQPAADCPPSKKARLKEKLQYDDLQSEEQQSSGPALRLTHPDRYLHGPTPLTATQYHTSEEILSACQATTQEIMGWRPNLPQVLSASAAVSVLGELSPGGALMQGCSNQQLDQMVPKDIQQELRQLYNALCELLRHFWACFPTTTKSLEEKVVKMYDTLERFQSAKIQPFKDKIHSFHFALDLVSHMEEMLQAAYHKYNTWYMKRTSKKS